MYSDEVRQIRELALKHELSPEVSVRLIRIAEDIMYKLSMPAGFKPEVIHLVATTISKESGELLEQEGLQNG